MIANTPFHHPYRLDAPSTQQAQGAVGWASFVRLPQLPADQQLLPVDPTVFAHAYLLLGERPERFSTGLKLYLATVRAFFEDNEATGGISIPPDGNSDLKRRLSEDLGVAFASFLMVEIFGATWDAISQIPQNSKLSKKRPDFQCFGNGNRFLFEAKGTTKLSGIEGALSKAIGQVKSYPEAAQMKTAVVTYLSADDRFFPSASFVVDPVALPETVPPDIETSQALHFEKALQFVDLSATAALYLRALSYKLRLERRLSLSDDGPTVAQERTFSREQARMTEEFRREREVLLDGATFLGERYIGRAYRDEETGLKVFRGISPAALERRLSFDTAPTVGHEAQVVLEDNSVTSRFPDDTLLEISREG